MMPEKNERSSSRFAGPPGIGRRPLSAALVVAMCCAGVPARAHEPPGARRAAESDNDVERAVREAIHAAFAAYKVGDLRDALQHFRTAWQLRPSRAIAQGLAQVEMELELYVAAAEHWQYVLERAEDEAQRTAVEAKLAECLEHVGRLRVELNVSGATLSVGEREFRDSSASEEIWVNPGHDRLTIERPGYEPYRGEFSVKPGETLELYVVLEQVAPSPQADFLRASAEPESDSTKPLLLVSGGVLTTVALVAGAIFHWQAKAELRNADVLLEITRREGDPEHVATSSQCLPDAPRRPDACDALARSFERGAKHQRHATIAFVAGGVLGAGTVATWLLWPSSSHAGEGGAGWSVGFYGKPHTPGVVLSGRF